MFRPQTTATTFFAAVSIRLARFLGETSDLFWPSEAFRGGIRNARHSDDDCASVVTRAQADRGACPEGSELDTTSCLRPQAPTRTLASV